MRRLLLLRANSVIIKRHVHPAARTGTWLAGLIARKPPLLVRVALANSERQGATGPSPPRTARIVWALMARGGVYRAPAATV